MAASKFVAAATVLCLSAGIAFGNEAAGKITDAKTGQPLSNVTVEVTGSSTPLRAISDSDGMYVLRGIPNVTPLYDLHSLGYHRQLPKKYQRMKIPANAQRLRITKYGYLADDFVVVDPGKSVRKDIALEPMKGFDWGRCAAVSVSSNPLYAHDVNDGNPTTGWHPLRVRPNVREWIQLAWDEPMSIGTVLVESAGPIRDYTIQASSDGATWTRVKRVRSSRKHHTRWIDAIELPEAVQARFLRILINGSSKTAVGNIWSFECYKPRGFVRGVVRDNAGAGIAGASVCAFESIGRGRGPSRLNIIGKTAGDGSYKIAVPEGSARITAWAPDSLAVAGEPIEISAGKIAHLEFTITDRVKESIKPFNDNFSSAHPAGWEPTSGNWNYANGRYRVDAAGDRWWGLYSLVKDVRCADSVVEADMYGWDGGLVMRLQDDDPRLPPGSDYDNLMIVWCFAYMGLDVTPFFWHPHVNGGWPETGRIDVVLDHHPAGFARVRAVVVGNKAQAWISDGQLTYLTPIITITDPQLLRKGRVALFKDINPLTPGEQQEFDNVSVFGGQ